MWIVRLVDQRIPYGPIADRAVAERFADFLTAEVDPAVVEPLDGPPAERLFDPVTALLNWRDAEQQRTPRPSVGEGPALGIEADLHHFHEQDDQ